MMVFFFYSLVERTETRRLFSFFEWCWDNTGTWGQSDRMSHTTLLIVIMPVCFLGWLLWCWRAVPILSLLFNGWHKACFFPLYFSVCAGKNGKIKVAAKSYLFFSTEFTCNAFYFHSSQLATRIEVAKAVLLTTEPIQPRATAWLALCWVEVQERPFSSTFLPSDDKFFTYRPEPLWWIVDFLLGRRAEVPAWGIMNAISSPLPGATSGHLPVPEGPTLWQ